MLEANCCAFMSVHPPRPRYHLPFLVPPFPLRHQSPLVTNTRHHHSSLVTATLITTHSSPSLARHLKCTYCFQFVEVMLSGVVDGQGMDCVESYWVGLGGTRHGCPGQGGDEKTMKRSWPGGEWRDWAGRGRGGSRGVNRERE